MDHKERHRRLRLLVRKLNKERKKQAQKTDLLCNDFISAHGDFIKRLNTINFTANFYEAILGTTDLSSLLHTAGKLLKEEISDSNVTFFLPGFSFRKESRNGVPQQPDNFGLYVSESDQPLVPAVTQAQAITLEKQHLENCFTPELVDNICKSNKLCTLDDMFAMGLQYRPPVSIRFVVGFYIDLPPVPEQVDSRGDKKHIRYSLRTIPSYTILPDKFTLCRLCSHLCLCRQAWK
ncbi:MAG: hypothetical protein ACYSWZ_02905 [Planctomycetota bacterium]